MVGSVVDRCLGEWSKSWDDLDISGYIWMKRSREFFGTFYPKQNTLSPYTKRRNSAECCASAAIYSKVKSDRYSISGIPHVGFDLDGDLSWFFVFFCTVAGAWLILAGQPLHLLPGGPSFHEQAPLLAEWVQRSHGGRCLISGAQVTKSPRTRLGWMGSDKVGLFYSGTAD